MATFIDELYDVDYDEVPCEFCDVLFPFELLMEHQSGCRPDLAQFQASDGEPVVKAQVQATTSVKSETLVKKASPQKETIIAKDVPLQKGTNTDKVAAQLNSVINKNVELLSRKEQIKKDLKSKSIIKDILASEEPALTFEDSLMQEKGPKLMAYGSSLYKNKIEEEKPSFKVPSLPLLNNADYKETENVSDSDDAGESLEDFWKRAEIQLSRRHNRKIKI